jgi:HPt (histidine-containing phosphotransfer) domain-containing protein
VGKTFDEAALLERVDGDVGFLDETVQMLEVDGQSLMRDVRAALAAGNAPAVGRTAHTLKGMISNFCSPTAQAAALAVEQAGKAGDLATAARAADALEQQLQDLIGELVQFVKARI